ncbi:hypothetical protein ACO22_03776 [Paracoccidioides brasiliensis]|uniref:Zn(2)-C6 fungal-type domain-containing protein n=1 Tax=Paracoccidioides brasiliensis TaxID=121759 RepID=A0A1D2JF41_PARBR|nr:hypothetical protein ACO22_03776 [Paracoccidioides brasiliensis]
MHSIRSAGRPLPFTPFGRAHGLSSDPLRFSLILNLPDNSCALHLRAPYLSPPMSGSPSPENRFDPLCGDRRRKRSISPIPTTSRGALQPLLSFAEPPAEAQGSDVLQPDSRRLSAGQPGISILGLPSIDDSQIRPTLPAGAFLPPRATPLPPRSTRRAKAHVASACVNCKKKHLGCESARPCRRCISAGKEESCVDVRHKRRGRPPLKAEEGPLRPYEPSFNHPGTSRPRPQGSSPISQIYSHRRASSSREIRPSTELQQSTSSSEIGGEYGRPRLSPAIGNTHMWTSPSRSQAMTLSPPLQGHFPRQPALSGGSSQPAPPHSSPLFSPGARPPSAFAPEYRDTPTSVHPFYGKRLPTNQSPSQYQQHQAPPPRSSYFARPGSPHGPLSSPPLSFSGAVRNYPFSGPSQPQITLPPLKPSNTSPELEFSQNIQHPPSAAAPTPLPPSLPSFQSGREPPNRVDRIQELEDSRPHPTQPPFQPAYFSTGSAGRRLFDSYRPMPLPPQPPPQQTLSQRQSRFSTSVSISNILPLAQLEKSFTTKEIEGESESRPAKRQKMALGDMVND